MKADEIKKVLSEARPGDQLLLFFRHSSLQHSSLILAMQGLVWLALRDSVKMESNHLDVLRQVVEDGFFRTSWNRRIRITIPVGFDPEIFAENFAHSFERVEKVDTTPIKLILDRRPVFPVKVFGGVAAGIAVVLWALSY